MKCSLPLALALVALACSAPRGLRVGTPTGLDLYVPVPSDNPLSAANVELGRQLFFDPILSMDRSLSCASCHRPEHGFTDTLPRAVGVYGRVGKRNAPTLVNVAWGRFFFWDGRVESLEEQVLRPIQDTLEMDLPLEEMVARLLTDPAYQRRFRAVFSDGITAGNVARALASFIRTIRSGDSPRDRFYQGDSTALSPEARRGLALFTGKANCTACHTGPLLSDEEFHNTGVSWESGDLGRLAVTGRDQDRGAFNTPTLRDVACTAPYMHDGSFRTVEDVIEHYDGGGGPNPYLDPEIKPLRLTGEEKRALAAFLRSLSGTRTEGSRRGMRSAC